MLWGITLFPFSVFHSCEAIRGGFDNGLAFGEKITGIRTHALLIFVQFLSQIKKSRIKQVSTNTGPRSAA